MSSESVWKDHYGTRERQIHAAELGMWVFLATEVLLFGALFVLYAVYRWDYPDTFRAEVGHEKLWEGGVMTALLMTSSFLVAQAVHLIRKGRPFLTALLLMGAVLLALGFLGIHGWEYAQHAMEGKLPGEWYQAHGSTMPGSNVFESLFFIMTGLHIFHVLTGCAVMTVISVQCIGGMYNAEFHTPVMNAALYWQLVDTIWMFLFVIFYASR